MKSSIALMGLLVAGTASAQTHPSHCPADKFIELSCQPTFKGAPTQNLGLTVGESSACTGMLRFTLNFQSAGMLVPHGKSTGAWGETFQGDFSGGAGNSATFLRISPFEQYVKVSKDLVRGLAQSGTMTELGSGVRYVWNCTVD